MNQQVAQPAQALGPNTRSLIVQWQTLCKELSCVKAQELKLRMQIAELFVPAPVEGTNTITGDGFIVKVVHKVNRKIDVAALDLVMRQLPEEYRSLGVVIDYQPKLVMAGYRAMPQQVQKVFEQALVITNGETPTLEVELKENVPTPIMDKYEEEKAKSTHAAKPKQSAQKPKSKKK